MDKTVFQTFSTAAIQVAEAVQAEHPEIAEGAEVALDGGMDVALAVAAHRGESSRVSLLVLDTNSGTFQEVFSARPDEPSVQ